MLTPILKLWSNMRIKSELKWAKPIYDILNDSELYKYQETCARLFEHEGSLDDFRDEVNWIKTYTSRKLAI